MAPTTIATAENRNEQEIYAAEGDAELIAHLQRHEATALAELYDRYGRLVHSQILRVVHDTGIAEDLVQETFLRVWNRVEFFDGHKGTIVPWLLAIARNRAIDYLRSVRLRDRSTVEFDEVGTPALLTNRDAEVNSFDQSCQIRAAMQKLVPHHMRVIELAYFEGLSHLEVAERMGQPLGTVKSWVRMALKHMRADLEVTRFSFQN
ncbi:MAG TPA: sigma-70 family RNA polymerase sigma factor [Bryobacteraceae bacterium]|jgi:RNA polymerase sigma-70 factor (ECF subfamily)